VCNLKAQYRGGVFSKKKERERGSDKKYRPLPPPFDFSIIIQREMPKKETAKEYITPFFLSFPFLYLVKAAGMTCRSFMKKRKPQSNTVQSKAAKGKGKKLN